MHESASPLRRYLEACNRGDWAGMREPFDPVAMFRQIPMDRDRNLEECLDLAGDFRRSFPDGHCAILDEVATPERNVIHYRYTGTLQHDFHGVRARGQKVSIDCVLIAHVKNGKITDLLEVWDAVNSTRQMGSILGAASEAERIGRAWVAAFNRKDIAAARSLFHPQIAYHEQPTGATYDREGLLHAMAEWCGAGDDMQVAEDEYFVMGDHAAFTYRYQGTITKNFLGVAGTGQKIDVPAAVVYHLHDGMIGEVWEYWDSAEMKRQLGDPAERNKAAARRIHDELFSAMKLELIDELVTDDFAMSSPHFATIAGKWALADTIRGLHAVCAGIHYDIEDLAAEGDKVMVRYVARGKHTAEFLGVPATDRPIAAGGMSILTFRNGRACRLDNQWDALGLLEQLGSAPSVLESNKTLARRFLEIFLNEDHHEIAPELFAPDIRFAVTHLPEVQGIDAMRNWARNLRRDIPDGRFRMRDLVAERDEVIYKWEFNGTHTNFWMGVPPTGKHLTIEGVTILKIRGNRIAESWTDWDMMRAMQSLGVVPEVQQRAAGNAG